MDNRVKKSFDSLKMYCETQEFKGWDPYDGLNSRVFQSTPLKTIPQFRWMWIQLFKRNTINLRKLALIEKDYNPKGLALFIIGFCNLYRLENNKEDLEKINFLCNKLIELISPGFSGSCWGYNFDWQIRCKYLFPKYTPTVVATSFAVQALAYAYEITKNEIYKEHIISAGNFIINDLRKTERKKGFLFSYSPLEGNNLVYNASLLGSKILSICYKYSGNSLFLHLAKESIIACTNSQNSDGSWFYGATDYQKWIDSFHTGYNLEAIKYFRDISGVTSFDENIERGFKFYINSFFLSDGTPKYYHNKIYPIDIHCPAQLFVTLYHLEKFWQFEGLANKVMYWTIQNMQTSKGYFIYQKKRLLSSRIPYMRWSQAFMFYAVTFYLSKVKNETSINF